MLTLGNLSIVFEVVMSHGISIIPGRVSVGLSKTLRHVFVKQKRHVLARLIFIIFLPPLHVCRRVYLRRKKKL
jgi:hypothetical protein